jgi:hypothetical protein
LNRDVIGGLIARVLAISDLVHNQTMELVGELSRSQMKLAGTAPDPAGVALLERYSASLRELSATEP